MENIEEIKKIIKEKLNNIDRLDKLMEVKSEFMGKKGIITILQSKIKELPNDKKKEFGMKVNEVKTLFNEMHDKLKKSPTSLVKIHISTKIISSEQRLMRLSFTRTLFPYIACLFLV